MDRAQNVYALALEVTKMTVTLPKLLQRQNYQNLPIKNSSS